jgi:hypothetical protein
LVKSALLFNQKIMTLSDERVQEFKDIYKKEHGKEMSDEEARESSERLVGLFDLLWKFSQEEGRREQRLKKESDGFPLEGEYTCLICRNRANGSNGIYHWGGPRCLICHKAIKDGTIPFYVLKNDDSFYRTWQLKDKFGIKSTQTVKKLVREGKLIPRTIMNGERVYEYIFLKKENPALVEKWNPVWKSHQRNRHKVSEAWGRKMKKEMKAEWEKTKKKYRLK